MPEEFENAGPSNYKFVVPAFRYEGVEYKSADVEKAVDAGDETAEAILAKLIEMKSGIVQRVDPAEEGEKE